MYFFFKLEFFIIFLIKLNIVVCGNDDRHSFITININKIINNNLVDYIYDIKKNSNLLNFLQLITGNNSSNIKQEKTSEINQINSCIILKKNNYFLRYDQWNLNLPIEFSPLNVTPSRIIINFIDQKLCDDYLFNLSKEIYGPDVVLNELRSTKNTFKIKFYYLLKKDLIFVSQFLSQIYNKTYQQIEYHDHCILYVLKDYYFNLHVLNLLHQSSINFYYQNIHKITRLLIFDKSNASFNCNDQYYKLQQEINNININFKFQLFEKTTNILLKSVTFEILDTELLSSVYRLINYEISCFKEKLYINTYNTTLIAKEDDVLEHCVLLKTNDFIMLYNWIPEISIKYTPLALNQTTILSYYVKISDCDQKLLYWSKKFSRENKVLINLRASNFLPSKKIKFYVESDFKLININKYLTNIFSFTNNQNNLENIKLVQFSHKCVIFVYPIKNCLYNVTNINFENKAYLLNESINLLVKNVVHIFIFDNDYSDKQICDEKKYNVLASYKLSVYNVIFLNNKHEIIYSLNEILKLNATFFELAIYFEMEHLVYDELSILRQYVRKECAMILHNNKIKVVYNFSMIVSQHVSRLDTIVFWSHETLAPCFYLVEQYRKLTNRTIA